MKQYSTISGLWRAPLFSKVFYIDVGLNWRGIGMLYLLMLEFLTWLVVLAWFAIIFSQFIDKEMTPALKDFPPITITAGVASSPVVQPYAMKSAHGTSFFGFDTTGAWKNPADVPAPLLVTDTEIVQDDGRGSIKRNSLKTIPDGTYDSAWILGKARWAQTWLIPLGVPLLALLCGFVRLMMALLMALIGLGLNIAFRGKLSFPALLRIAIVSMTSSMLISTALYFVNVNFGCAEYVLLPGLTIGYMVFGVKMAADASHPPEAFPVELTNPNGINPIPTIDLPGTPPPGASDRHDLFP